MSVNFPTIGNGQLKPNQWIQFCTQDSVNERLETIYQEKQFYFISSIKSIRGLDGKQHIYVFDAEKNGHKFCTNRMRLDSDSLNRNTQIRFVSKEAVKAALERIDFQWFEDKVGSASCLSDSESTDVVSELSSEDKDSSIGWDFSQGDSDGEVEQDNASSSSRLVSTEPDGMDLFCPDSENHNDFDSLGCPIS